MSDLKEEIWNKHFKGWTIAGQIKRNTLPAMQEYAESYHQAMLKDYVLKSEYDLLSEGFEEWKKEIGEIQDDNIRVYKENEKLKEGRYYWVEIKSESDLPPVYWKGTLKCNNVSRNSNYNDAAKSFFNYPDNLYKWLCESPTPAKEVVKDEVYEIDFAGHVKTRIKVSDNKLEITDAMNGFGNNMPLNLIKIEPTQSPSTKDKEREVAIDKDVIANIITHDELDTDIKDFLYPKLYRLYNEKKLNKGHLPEKKSAEEAIFIDCYSVNENIIRVEFQIHWGGDCYDNETILKTLDEWNEIIDFK